MFTAVERLRELKVSDVMARTTFTLSPSHTLDEAARVFAEHKISSAPVVDEQGFCVGMLSATDFLKRELPTDGGMRSHELVQERPGAALQLVAHDDRVEHRMTTAVQAVMADASLLQAARIMCAAHLHRLPVLERGRVQGVVSTMDLVAALVNAVEEVTAHPSTAAYG